jgi:hypothetical protein
MGRRLAVALLMVLLVGGLVPPANAADSVDHGVAQANLVGGLGIGDGQLELIGILHFGGRSWAGVAHLDRAPPDYNHWVLNGTGALGAKLHGTCYEKQYRFNGIYDRLALRCTARVGAGQVQTRPLVLVLAYVMITGGQVCFAYECIYRPYYGGFYIATYQLG